MKELKDKDFDELFRSRITEEIPAFEEESWLKMEEKLRKKDRLLLYRYASIILLLLSFGLAFYFLNKKATIKLEIATEQIKKAIPVDSALSTNDRALPVLVEGKNENLATYSIQSPKTKVNEQRIILHGDNSTLLEIQGTNKVVNSPTDIASAPHNPANVNPGLIVQKEAVVEAQQTAGNQETVSIASTEEPTSTNKKGKIKRKLPISLAINVGPDFNSTSAIIGGKTSLAVGVAIGVRITKKLSIQTGLNYGRKNYNTTAYNYTFSNPNAINTVEQVQAACKVLEIPLRASLNVSENKKRRIELNAGLSSYLMLKEDYTFKYHPSLNRADRFAQVTNENKHILSVLDLSASYDVKLKNKNLALGIEPYVKIPLTGIGEGNVSLKSSGISLKLRYDFNKKP